MMPPFCFCFLSLQPLHEADSGGTSILPWQQCDSPWCKGELSRSQASETTEHVPWLAKDNLLNIFITPEMYTAHCYCLPVKMLSSLLVGRQMLKATHALPEIFPRLPLLILSLVTLWFLELTTMRSLFFSVWQTNTSARVGASVADRGKINIEHVTSCK